ncbi:hypothetical protein [Bacillus wiedmannii]|uniref:hypothetical protein n=1 Tax=Bacillus wiedmannii TaxID=1890302 RepID=UPI000BEDBF38|nr:hypothetical protein [Bacillus wiedmannii]PEA42828.1 hypothetical protein CON83_19570 [Bacillus wiedmannii]
MFKIETLTLKSSLAEYKYEFQHGINYFQGTNATGKTEYFRFIDYMFGSSDKTLEKEWFDNIDSASLKFTYEKNSYFITRNLRKKDQNDFICLGSIKALNISQAEFRMKLNSVFSKGSINTQNLEAFVGEKLTHRTFTIFNFLSEKSQGKLHDFFSKSEELKYSIKLPMLLDYIFNPNLMKIQEIKSEINKLQMEIKKFEIEKEKQMFIQEQINNQLGILNIPTIFDGKVKSKEKILELIQKFEENNLPKRSEVKNTITDFQSMYMNLDQQIKVYMNRINDLKKFKKDDENKKVLYTTFKEIIEENPQVEYLVNPIKKMISNVDKNIAFTNHYIINNTVDKLIQQKKQIEVEINKRAAELEIYQSSEVEKALIVLKNYLDISLIELEEIEHLRKKLNEKRNELKILQNANDEDKIKKISNIITGLYLSAANVSAFVRNDKEKDIYIKYFKKGNIIQPTIKDDNIYVGSMARHTLLQVCGYLAFLELLIREDKYPLIPMLCFDHISKPFDSSNLKAIGAVLDEIYVSIPKQDLQIFIFDEKEPEDFGLTVDHYENLVTPDKSGFIPFFQKRS